MGLIFANEAYWNNGAIKQVLQSHQKLDYREGVEAVFMNLGYAMEHLVHEFIQGDSAARATEGKTYGKHFSDVTMANYGDGLIKFGKYMSRAVKALQAMKVK